VPSLYAEFFGGSEAGPGDLYVGLAGKSTYNAGSTISQRQGGDCFGVTHASLTTTFSIAAIAIVSLRDRGVNPSDGIHNLLVQTQQGDQAAIDALLEVIRPWLWQAIRGFADPERPDESTSDLA
jgi:hypothetical protein